MPLAPSQAIQFAINRTSIDLSMVPLDDSFSVSLAKLVRTGVIPESRIDESAARVMQVRIEGGGVEARADGRCLAGERHGGAGLRQGRRGWGAPWPS
jgi:hypothetical protein